MVPHGLQKLLRAREIADAMVDVAMQLEHVHAEPVAPVVEAVPLEVSPQRLILRKQLIPRGLDADAARVRVPLRNEPVPDIVVEGEVEHRAVHVQHQRLASIQHRLRIHIRCSGYSDHLYFAPCAPSGSPNEVHGLYRTDRHSRP